MWPLASAGLVRAILPVITCSTVVNLAVSIAATAIVGLPGPLIGTAAASAALNWWWVLMLLNRHLGVPPRRLLAAAARAGVLAIVYGAGLLLVARSIPAYTSGSPRWSRLLIDGQWIAVAACGYLVLSWFLAVPATDRAEWVGRLSGWLRYTPMVARSRTDAQRADRCCRDGSSAR
jgi:hypothetical protein